MGTDNVKRLKLLKQKKSWLKKVLAKRDLKIQIMKKIVFRSQLLSK
jgi:hypothetical protein